MIPALVELPRSTGYGFGGSAIAAGLFMLPTAAVQLVVGPFTGRIEHRLGSRVQLQFGMACLLIAYVALAHAHRTALELGCELHDARAVAVQVVTRSVNVRAALVTALPFTQREP